MTQRKRIVVLGSTGSIGVQALNVIAASEELEVVALSAQSNWEPLLKLAHSRGLAVISGIEMFVQQGARQFEIWTGKPAPENEMLRVVEQALRKRA